MQEADLVLPVGWQDQSITIFTSGGDEFDPNTPPGECSFVITRAPRPPEQGLYAYVSDQLAQLTTTLPQFRLLQRLSLNLGASAAEQAEFVWTGEHGPMRQQQTCAMWGEVALTLTATTREAAWMKYEFAIQSLVYSVQLTTPPPSQRGSV